MLAVFKITLVKYLRITYLTVISEDGESNEGEPYR